ncbi:hypothetical protein GOQ27_15095 [Clostridium sp. D2Q-11]|uniref:Uncharacterized protein n=1 Tax=Anaeromonas frigoriresistens TaxID=2683708 RepID=A0A942ZA29_9FIRM|nr:hypothetical protein [Anaeromonas frigoriresistens]MBS4539799.1 hypothetical protein [Anaeromonas frigoriresistens]
MLGRDYTYINKALDEILIRTGGEFSRMSKKDKLTVSSIMKVLKKDFEKKFSENYPYMSQWAEMDMEDILRG